MRDIVAELDLTRRRVQRLDDHEGAGTADDLYDVELRRTYDAEPADVWDAITDPERIARWFSPVSGDLREGGTYAIEGNASGAITRCDPPRHLALDWAMNDALSWVTVDLVPVDGGGCELVLTHRQPRTDHWATYGPGATGVGWELSVLGLAWHLEGVASPPKEFEGNPSARAAMRHSAAAWGAAHAAAGAPEPVAEKAARATADAYAPE